MLFGRAILMVWAMLLPNLAMAFSLSDYSIVGKARLEVWFFDIYQSTLLTLDGRYQKGQYPVVLQIQYLRDIKARQLIKHTHEQWQSIGLEHPDNTQWLQDLQNILPDVKTGDELMLVYRGPAMSQFYYNNKHLGNIVKTGFGEQFLAIWLDERSRYPQLRKQLLGK